LSFWTESPESEAPYISLTLGSLTGEDLRDLEELGLLPEEVVADVEKDKGTLAKGLTSEAVQVEGLPWFETMVSGSKLGNIRRQGEKRQGNGWKVEWEIVEWTEGDEDLPEMAATGGKRKLGELVGEEDVPMR